jgi:hypothetical protein
MIERVTEASGLKAVMANTPTLKHVYCDMDEWIANPNHIALESDGNFGVFEYEYPGVYTGHYFFASARGRTALQLSKAMLAIVFDEHKAKLIRGMTPTHHKGALWMNRQLGFKSHGVVETIAGPHELVMLTDTDFEDIRI